MSASSHWEDTQGDEEMAPPGRDTHQRLHVALLESHWPGLVTCFHTVVTDSSITMGDRRGRWWGGISSGYLPLCTPAALPPPPFNSLDRMSSLHRLFPLPGTLFLSFCLVNSSPRSHSDITGPRQAPALCSPHTGLAAPAPSVFCDYPSG